MKKHDKSEIQSSGLSSHVTETAISCTGLLGNRSNIWQHISKSTVWECKTKTLLSPKKEQERVRTGTYDFQCEESHKNWIHRIKDLDFKLILGKCDKYITIVQWNVLFKVTFQNNNKFLLKFKCKKCHRAFIPLFYFTSRPPLRTGRFVRSN